MDEQYTKTVQAADISCQIIQALKELNGAGVTELSQHLQYSKSTIHSHLATLKENQFVVKDGIEYRLSLQFLNIGSYVRDQFKNYNIIKKELDKLAQETGEVAQFAIEEHGMVTYLYKATGKEGVSTASRIGTKQPMHSTSLGKSILAHMSDDQIKTIVDKHGLPPKTNNTITDQNELYDELQLTRERGFAVDDEENVAGLRCVSSSVMNDGTIFGAVSVSGPSSRIEDELFLEKLPSQVIRTANVIELNSQFSN